MSRLLLVCENQSITRQWRFVKCSLVVLEAVLRWARVHTPAGEDPVAAVADLLPPQTLFNSTNKRVMLGMRATLFI